MTASPAYSRPPQRIDGTLELRGVDTTRFFAGTPAAPPSAGAQRTPRGYDDEAPIKRQKRAVAPKRAVGRPRKPRPEPPPKPKRLARTGRRDYDVWRIENTVTRVWAFFTDFVAETGEMPTVKETHEFCRIGSSSLVNAKHELVKSGALSVSGEGSNVRYRLEVPYEGERAERRIHHQLVYGSDVISVGVGHSIRQLETGEVLALVIGGVGGDRRVIRLRVMEDHDV